MTEVTDYETINAQIREKLTDPPDDAARDGCTPRDRDRHDGPTLRLAGADTNPHLVRDRGGAGIPPDEATRYVLECSVRDTLAHGDCGCGKSNPPPPQKQIGEMRTLRTESFHVGRCLFECQKCDKRHEVEARVMTDDPARRYFAAPREKGNQS